MKVAICIISNNEESLATFADTLPKNHGFIVCVAANGALTLARAEAIAARQHGTWRVSWGNYRNQGKFDFAACRCASFALADDCDVIMMADDDLRFREVPRGATPWAISSVDALRNAADYVSKNEECGLIQLYSFLGGASSAGQYAPIKQFNYELGLGLVFRREMAQYMPRTLYGGAEDNLFGARIYMAGYTCLRRFGVTTRKKPTQRFGDPGCLSHDVLQKGMYKEFRELTGHDFIPVMRIPPDCRALHEGEAKKRFK